MEDLSSSFIKVKEEDGNDQQLFICQVPSIFLAKSIILGAYPCTKVVKSMGRVNVQHKSLTLHFYDETFHTKFEVWKQLHWEDVN